MGHSSEGHLGSGMKVLQISSNFHHQFLSMRQVYPENFSSMSLTVQFLWHFSFSEILRKVHFCSQNQL